MFAVITQPRQTTRHSMGVFGLSGLTGITSPYFRNTERFNLDRDINLIRNSMTMIAIINGIGINSPPSSGLLVQYTDLTTGVVDAENLTFNITGLTTNAAIKSAAETAVDAYAVSQGYTITNKFWMTDDVTSPPAVRTTSSLGLSIVGTGATGTQISSTKDSSVKLNVSTSATASIAGAAISTVTLKKCATNSATEGNWTTAGILETSQSYSLAVAIQGVTGSKGQLVSDIPSGWYVKLVSSGSGTHAETSISGEQTIYG